MPRQIAGPEKAAPWHARPGAATQHPLNAPAASHPPSSSQPPTTTAALSPHATCRAATHPAAADKGVPLLAGLLIPAGGVKHIAAADTLLITILGARAAHIVCAGISRQPPQEWVLCRCCSLCRRRSRLLLLAGGRPCPCPRRNGGCPTASAASAAAAHAADGCEDAAVDAFQILCCHQGPLEALPLAVILLACARPLLRLPAGRHTGRSWQGANVCWRQGRAVARASGNLPHSSGNEH